MMGLIPIGVITLGVMAFTGYHFEALIGVTVSTLIGSFVMFDK